MAKKKEKKSFSIPKKIPTVWEVQNFGASREIPSDKGNFFLGRSALVYTKSTKEKKIYCSVPFVEARKKENFAGIAVQALRKLATKRGIKDCFKLKKSELIQRMGGVDYDSQRHQATG